MGLKKGLGVERDTIRKRKRKREKVRKVAKERRVTGWTDEGNAED